MITPASLGLFGTWRDELISASFRGAEFYVLNSERVAGRKVRVSTYYGTDEAFIEDLGKASDEFMIEGYVIANGSNQLNYFLQRDRLIDALTTGKGGSSNIAKHANSWGQIQDIGKDTGNPGTLKHPFYGEIKAYLKEPARIVETFDEGGIARFTMIFIRWDEGPQEKFSSFDIAKLVLDQSLSTYNAFIDDFAAWMNVGGAFINAVGSVMRTVLKGVSKMISSVQGGIASSLSASAAIANEALNFTDDILSSPCQIASTIGMGVDSVLSAVGISSEAVSGGIVGLCSGELRGSIYKLDGSYIPEKLTVSCTRRILINSRRSETDCTDPIPDEQLDNAKAVADLYQALCLRNACVVAVTGSYSSKDLAQEIMDDVLDYIDAFLLRLGERTMDVTLAYNAMEQMRNTFSKCMYAKMESLEQLTSYVIPANGMNSLVLAYNKFDDISRSDEIFEMNRTIMEHPGFLPGGSSINMLDS